MAQGSTGTPTETNGAPPLPVEDRSFVNPAGDRNRTEAFADWNLDATLPAPAAVPEPGVLERAIEDGRALNPEGDTPPHERQPKPKPQPPTTADGRPETAPGPSEGDGQPSEEITGAEGLERILAKYQTKEGLARGYKALQQLQTAQASKAKKEIDDLQRQLAERYEIFDEYFEMGDDGKPALRPERAVEVLRRGTPPPVMLDEQAVRRQAEAEYREYLKEIGTDDDDVPMALERSKGRIESRAKELIVHRQTEMRRHFEDQRARASGVIESFFNKNPQYDTEPVKKDLDSILARFPPQARPAVILEGLLPLPRLAQAFEALNGREALIREVWAEAEKFFTERSVEPTAGSAPSPGSSAPRQRGVAVDPNAELKARMLRAGTLPSIFD